LKSCDTIAIIFKQVIGQDSCVRSNSMKEQKKLLKNEEKVKYIVHVLHRMT